MKHKLTQLIAVIVIAAFTWQGQFAYSNGGQVGIENRLPCRQAGKRYKGCLRPMAAEENGRAVGDEQIEGDAHIIPRRELPAIQGVIFDALELEDHPGRILAPVIRHMELRYDSLVEELLKASIRPMEARKIIGVVQFPTTHLVRIALAPALAKKRRQVYQVGHFYLAQKAGFGDKGYGYSNFGLDISKRTVRINTDKNVLQEGHVVYLDSMHNQIVRIARILSATLGALRDEETSQPQFSEQDVHDFTLLPAESNLVQVLQGNLAPDTWITLNRSGRLLLGDIAALSLFPESGETAEMILNENDLRNIVTSYLDQVYQLVQKYRMERILTRLIFIESQVIVGDFEELQDNFNRLIRALEKSLQMPDNSIEKNQDLKAAKQIILQARRIVVNFNSFESDAIPQSAALENPIERVLGESILRPRAFADKVSEASDEFPFIQEAIAMTEPVEGMGGERRTLLRINREIITHLSQRDLDKIIEIITSNYETIANERSRYVELDDPVAHINGEELEVPIRVFQIKGVVFDAGTKVLFHKGRGNLRYTPHVTR
jgi:hypothetical protein